MPLLGIVLIAQLGFTPVERVTPAPTPAPVSCEKAANPAIESASAQRTDRSGGISQYTIHVSVLNRGVRKQPPDLQASVVVSQNGEKIATQIVPPLDPGVAFAFSTHFKRSSDAGPGSSTLVFKYQIAGRTAPNADDCKAVDDIFALTF